MDKELSQVPTHGGPAVKVAVPVSQLTQFAVVTSRSRWSPSPTLVIIDPKGQATTITGCAYLGEITQRIDDALPAK